MPSIKAPEDSQKIVKDITDNPAQFVLDLAVAMEDMRRLDNYLMALDIPERDENGDYVSFVDRVREAIKRGRYEPESQS